MTDHKTVPSGPVHEVIDGDDQWQNHQSHRVHNGPAEGGEGCPTNSSSSLDDMWSDAYPLRVSLVPRVDAAAVEAVDVDGSCCDWLSQLPADARVVQLVSCRLLKLVCVTTATARSCYWRVLLVHAPISIDSNDNPEPQQEGSDDDLGGVTQQLVLSECECACVNLSCQTVSSNSEQTGLCQLHGRLLQLLASRAASGNCCVSVCVERRLCVPLLLRVLAASSHTHRQLQVTLDSSRQLRSWLVHDVPRSTVTVAGSGDITAVDAKNGTSSTGALSHISRVALVSRESSCVDVVSLAALWPRAQLLDVRRRGGGDGCLPDALKSGGGGERRCVCKWRSSGGGPVLLPCLTGVRLQLCCAQTVAAIRSASRALHTLCLVQCRLEQPPAPSAASVASCSTTASSGAMTTGVATTGGAASARRQSRSFRDIIDAVLRRRHVAPPNIQIRQLSVVDEFVSMELINNNFPCLKRLHVDSSDDGALGSEEWAGCGDVDGGERMSSTASSTDASLRQPTPSALWFPSLERVQLTYRATPSYQEPPVVVSGRAGVQPAILSATCGGGGCGMVRLMRLVEYTQHFGCISLHRLAAQCPNLRSLTLDPVLLCPPPSPLSISSPRSSSGTSETSSSDECWTFARLQRFEVSWCDADTVAAVTARMPALRDVIVLEPSVVDKSTWIGVTEILRSRRVQVHLNW